MSRDVDYNTYIKSDAWRAVKARYWASKLPKVCYVCGTKKRLDLHHRTYTRLGHERLDDLIPLCRTHHQSVHDLLKNRRSSAKIKLYTAHKRVKARYQRGLRGDDLSFVGPAQTPKSEDRALSYLGGRPDRSLEKIEADEAREAKRQARTPRGGGLNAAARLAKWQEKHPGVPIPANHKKQRKRRKRRARQHA